MKAKNVITKRLLALLVVMCMALSPAASVFAETGADTGEPQNNEMTVPDKPDAVEKENGKDKISDKPEETEKEIQKETQQAVQDDAQKNEEPEQKTAAKTKRASKKAETVDKKKVQLTAQKSGAFMFAPKLAEEVSSDLSDKYGFTGEDSYTDGDTVSLIDVLIRAHELAYGDKFTPATVGNYLGTGISSSGKVVVNKMFEKEGNYYNFDFAVNGRLPGQQYPCGQNIDFYPINVIHPIDGDVVEFFVEQNGAKDEYSWLEKGGRYISELTIQQNKETSVKVKGIKYFVKANRYGDADRMKEDGELLNHVKLATVNMKTGELTPIEGSETDENGVAKIKMTENGKYYVVVMPDGTEDAPTIIMTLMELTVTDAPDPEAVAPETITIVPDAKKIVKHTYTGYSGETTDDYFMCTEKNGTKLALKAVDQNGKETPVSWSGTSANYIKFADSTEGVATVTNTTTYSSSVTVIAQSMIDGCNVKGTYKFKVIPALAARAGYNGDYKDSVDISFTMDPETGRFGEAKPGSPYIIASSDYISNGMVDVKIADKSIVSAATSYSTLTLTPLKPGKTTVTICDKYDDQNCATINVDVKGIVVKAGEDVRSTKTFVGGTKQLTYESAKPDDKITWSSSDESIVTVDENGLVKGVKTGAAKIYAENADGEKGVIKVGVLPTEDSVVLRNLVIKSPSDFYTSDDYNTSSRLVSESAYDDDYQWSISGYWVDTYADINETYYVKSSTTKMTFVPLFSPDVKVEAYLDGKQVAVGENTKEMAVNLHPLMNEVEVRAIDAKNPKITNSYKYHVYRERSDKATMKMMSVYPSEREISSKLQFAGSNEGTLFIMDDKWEYKKPSWGSGYSTISSTGSIGNNDKKLRSHVFKDVDAFTVDLTASDKEGAHIRYAVGDSEDFTEGVGNITTKKISFGTGRDSITLNVQSVSDKVYAECENSGTDPWESDTVVTYQLNIKQIPVDPSELSLKSMAAETEGCIPMTPVFSETNPLFALMVPADATNLNIKAVPNSKGATAYCHSNTYNLYTDQYKLTSAEDGSYTINIKPKSSYGNDRYFALAKDVDGMTASAQYQIKIEKITDGTDRAGLPDEISDFLSIGGTNTNKDDSSHSGLFPERSIKSTGAYAVKLGLGSFGGYVTYHYKDGIKNDPSNPYGVDFTVFARSASDSNPAASSVYVSQDGKEWYELAGSEHYDKDTVWNYSVKYKNEDGIATFTDSLGREESTGYAYPSGENYPKYDGDMSFEGTLLLGANGQSYAAADSTVMPYSWGYVGAHKPGSIASNKPVAETVGNPYVEGYDGYGDGYDISWAVDKEGKPVKLDEINYVKVSSASMIKTTSADKGGQGRVANVVVSDAGDGSDVGVTDAPESINIGGSELILEKDKTDYKVKVGSDAFDVNVAAKDDTNVYINNIRANERSYDEDHPFDFEKGIVRIILQKDEAAPVIYYIEVERANVSIDEATDSIETSGKANEVAADANEVAKKSKEAAEKAMDEPGEQAVAAAAKAKTDAENAVKKAEEAVKAAQDAIKSAEAAVKGAESEKLKKKAEGMLEEAEKQLEEAEKAKKQADKLLDSAKTNERIANAEAGKKAAEEELAKEKQAAADKVAAEEAAKKKAAEEAEAAKKKAAEEAAKEAAMKKVKTVKVNVKTVNAKALDKAVANAKGSSKYVTKFVLGKKVKKIAKNAFKAYKKVTTLQIKTKKLKKKAVKGSLKGSKIQKIQVKVSSSKKVNKKYVKKYKKIFTKKNAGKKVKVK